MSIISADLQASIKVAGPDGLEVIDPEEGTRLRLRVQPPRPCLRISSRRRRYSYKHCFLDPVDETAEERGKVVRARELEVGCPSYSMADIDDGGLGKTDDAFKSSADVDVEFRLAPCLMPECLYYSGTFPK